MNQNNRNNPRYPPQRHFSHQRYSPRPQAQSGNLNPNAPNFQPQPYRFDHHSSNLNQMMWNERFSVPPPPSHMHQSMNFQQPPPNFGRPPFPIPPQNMNLPPRSPNMGPPPQNMGPPPQNMGPPPQNMGLPPQNIGPSSHNRGEPPNLNRSLHPHHISASSSHPLNNMMSPFLSSSPMTSPKVQINPPFQQQPQVMDNSTFDEHPADPKKVYKETMIDVVKKWLNCKNIRNDKDDAVKENASGSLMKIHEYKSTLKDLFSKIETLRTMNDKLAENMEISTEKWDQLIEQVKTLKEEVSIIQEKVLQTKQVEFIDELLTQRRKKRKRMQRKKEEEKEEHLKELSKRMKLNQMIDEWQHKEFSNIQREKMLESLKTEAGESLTEVKRKQSETQELLQVLQYLTELREIRKQTAIYKGIFVTQEDDDAFQKKIDDATQLLHEQNKIYLDEERALRVLREEEAEDFERNEVEKRQKRKQKHEKALSKVDPMQIFRAYWCQGEESISGVIHIRSLWDSYLCGPLTPGSSRLPDESPEPCKASSQLWEKFLIQSTDQQI